MSTKIQQLKTKKSLLKKTKIIKELSFLSNEKLEELDAFIKNLLKKEEKQKQKIKEPATLEGIWKNKGIEKISNIEMEITKTRKLLGEQLLHRSY